MNIQQLDNFVNFVDTYPDRRKLVKGLCASSDTRKEGARVLARMPAVFVHKLMHVESLRIDIDGTGETLFHYSFFLFLRDFTSITKLVITRMNFRTVTEFGRLVCAIPNLTTLVCRKVTWSDLTYSKKAFMRSKPSLKLLSVTGTVDASFWTKDIVDWLFTASTPTATPRAPSPIPGKLSLPMLDLMSADPDDVAHLTRLLDGVSASLRRLNIGFTRKCGTRINAENIMALSLQGHFLLEELYIWIYADAGNDLRWVLAMLRTIESRCLRHVCLRIEPNWIQLPSLPCTHIDLLFSDPKFDSLERFTLMYDRSAANVRGPLEENLQTQFPGLFSRGIAHVDFSRVTYPSTGDRFF
ncbi:hypothetical protein B0H21DRAFT_821203 [Amylocystis lapponica]|nr:hypothetical protein B0H21DRAFT_821203 [Amylocystis lapponica]